MTETDQIKILNRKINQNESQYDLDREAAKISAQSSKNLDKYELSTGEDLGLKPSTVEQAKFEYSPLDKIFNKGLSEEDKKEGLLKRLKNTEYKNKVKNKANENIIEVTDFVDQPLSSEAKEFIKLKSYRTMLIKENKKLGVVTILILILVITEHLKNYLEIFITEQLQ